MVPPVKSLASFSGEVFAFSASSPLVGRVLSLRFPHFHELDEEYRACLLVCRHSDWQFLVRFRWMTSHHLFSVTGVHLRLAFWNCFLWFPPSLPTLVCVSLPPPSFLNFVYPSVWDQISRFCLFLGVSSFSLTVPENCPSDTYNPWLASVAQDQLINLDSVAIPLRGFLEATVLLAPFLLVAEV